MSQPNIVKIIQRCYTWGSVQDRGVGDYAVPVYFTNRADAEAFKVELMMVASGQHGYELDADNQQPAPQSLTETKP